MICKCLPQRSHHLRASFCCMFQSHSNCGRGLVLGEGGVRGKRRGRAWGLSPRAVYIPQWSSPFSGPSSQESFTSPLRGVPTREHTLPSAGLSAADRAFPTVGSRHGEGGRGDTPVYTPQQELHVCTIQPSFIRALKVPTPGSVSLDIIRIVFIRRPERGQAEVLTCHRCHRLPKHLTTVLR
jgi:hypothetical protein